MSCPLILLLSQSTLTTLPSLCLLMIAHKILETESHYSWLVTFQTLGCRPCHQFVRHNTFQFVRCCISFQTSTSFYYYSFCSFIWLFITFVLFRLNSVITSFSFFLLNQVSTLFRLWSLWLVLSLKVCVLSLPLCPGKTWTHVNFQS